MTNEQLPRGRGPNTVYDYDTYWRQLLDRVYGGETLEGSERLFHRLSIIRGEVYDDVSEYFDKEWEHFDDDMRDLEATGFGDVARELKDLRVRLFGDTPLTEELIEDFMDRYWEDEDDPLHEELEGFSERLQPRFDDLQDYRDQLGLREKFYLHLDW